MNIGKVPVQMVQRGGGQIATGSSRDETLDAVYEYLIFARKEIPSATLRTDVLVDCL